MADLFISHASEDLKVVKMLASAFDRSGWSVWYSKEPGESTEKELQSAEAVVVLWSQFSATDRYVIGEVQEAFQSNTLFPALLEDVFLSAPFDDLDTTNLIDWNGDTNHPEFKRLVEKISQVVTPKPRTTNQELGTPEPHEVLITPSEAATEKPLAPSESLIKEESEVTHLPAPENKKQGMPVFWSATPQAGNGSIFKRKYLIYAGLAALILIVGWKVIWNKSGPVEDTSSTPAAIYPEKSGDTDEPSKVGLTAKRITPDLANTSSTNDFETADAETAIETEPQPQTERLVENINEDTTVNVQPKVYYPPAQKEGDEPIPDESLASHIAETTSGPLNPEKSSDSLALLAENELVKAESLYAASGIGAEARSDFSVGETVFIGATVYPTANENFRLEWSTSDGLVLAEKRISTGKNSNGLNIYDSKQQFPGTTGQFRVRLYNNENQLLAETVFNVR
ncbi:MAG: toll/interleukin-1 receptor domain-containing protein [Cyclobacteriaceae bacterium]